ncbi:transposase [Pantoea sp. NSTU24]
MIDKTTVGIDVSKFALDVFIDTSERLIHLENSASGIMQLLKELEGLHISGVIMEASRLQEKNGTYIETGIAAHIAWLNSQIDILDKEIKYQLNQNAALFAKRKMLEKVKGVGPVTQAAILSQLPELGALTRRQISALVGVCPYDRDSGQLRGKRAIWGGRAGLRATLYMAMLSAIRYNPQIKDFYTSLIARGKVKKFAITACIRKFITILNAMFRDQKDWIYS